jgi:type IV pilus assembly protein PilQ
MLPAWLTIFLCTPLHAAQLNSASWDEGAAPPTVDLAITGASRYETQVLENGMRLRLVLPDTSLSTDMADLPGRGAVKGVFPYIGGDGSTVNVDFLVNEPARLDVAPASNGLRVAIAGGVAAATATAASGTTSTPPAGGRNPLEDITFAQMPGDRVEIKLHTSTRPAEPGTFSIARPPRISLDLFETGNALGSKSIPVNYGAVESVSTVSANGRTRVVLNLTDAVSFTTRIEDDGVLVAVDSPQAGLAASGRTERFAEETQPGDHAITKVDFRRGADGAGQVIVTLSDPGIGIDMREQYNEITVDFVGTGVPADLEQRLDVVDFATPVQTIDTFRKGKNTRIVVNATGRYDHSAYQAGNVFTVSVKPITKKDEELKSDEFGYSGEKLSLNFQNIEVRAALQVIADFTGLNFVTSDSVKGTLTLRLRDVPWDQALDIILRTRGLAMREQGNVVWVAPAEEIAAKEKQALEANKAVSDLEPLVSELIQINYAKASDIAALLKSVKAVDTGIESRSFSSVTVSNIETEANTLLSPRGNVTVDARTNSILIQDTAGKIREVKKLIAKLDRPVRQVMIETRIVEANDGFSKSLGARFGVINRNRSFHLPGNTETNLGDAVLSPKIEDADPIINTDTYPLGGDSLNVDLPSPGVNGFSPGSLAFTLFKIDSTHLLSLELNALEAEGKGKIIASPRLVTANQKQAHIEQGQERLQEATGLASEGTIVEAKLSLTVTPQITPEDSIILDVDITQDTFANATANLVNTKQINTQVLLDNGETVVIGGIYQQEDNLDVTKIPLFGDLPLVGALFRNTNKVTNRTELLIFLTPRLLNSALTLTEG